MTRDKYGLDITTYREKLSENTNQEAWKLFKSKKYIPLVIKVTENTGGTIKGFNVEYTII